jgi:hypothetical protein
MSDEYDTKRIQELRDSSESLRKYIIDAKWKIRELDGMITDLMIYREDKVAELMALDDTYEDDEMDKPDSGFVKEAIEIENRVEREIDEIRKKQERWNDQIKAMTREKEEVDSLLKDLS